MAAVPKFQNNEGLASIRIGAREFECIGASPPHDHPHIFLDMGADDEIICSYCATRYIYDATLTPAASNPPDAAVEG